MSTKYTPFNLDPDECAQLDADCQVHYLAVLAEFHSHIDHQAEIGMLSATEWAYYSYRLGNMEGRLICNCWTLDDYEQVAVWEQELEEYRNEHKGTIFPDIIYPPKED